MRLNLSCGIFFANSELQSKTQSRRTKRMDGSRSKSQERRLRAFSKSRVRSQTNLTKRVGDRLASGLNGVEKCAARITRAFLSATAPSQNRWTNDRTRSATVGRRPLSLARFVR